MQDIGEAVLDAVATMAAVSFCLMGVAVKQEPRLEAPKAQQVVVRRTPPQKPARAVVVGSENDKPERQRV